MAIPLKLRAEVYADKAGRSEDMCLHCDRCEMTLIAPGRPGEMRKRENARMEYIVLPGHGGEKEVRNVTVLCGECVEEWREVRKYMMLRKQWEKWVREGEKVEDMGDDARDIKPLLPDDLEEDEDPWEAILRTEEKGQDQSTGDGEVHD